MAVNDPITALEYNNIYNIMAPIVGTAATGYGRNLSSSTVVGGSTPGVSDRVTSVQHRDLFLIYKQVTCINMAVLMVR